MGIFDGGADLLKQLQPLADGEVSFVTEFCDWTACNIFHHDVLPAIFGDAAIKQSSDIRMVEFGLNPAFLLETPGGFLRRDTRPDHFDGDFFVKTVVGAFGQINHSHSTTPNFAEDAV